MTNEECAARNAEREAQQEAKEANSRLETAHIPTRFRGKGFGEYSAILPQQQRVLEIARSYADNFRDHLTVGRSLAFMGSIGTGKTHLACATLQTLAHHRFPEKAGFYTPVGYRVRYATSAEIIRNLRGTWRRDSDTSEEQVLIDLAAYHLLAIDEIGVGFGTEGERAQLSELIDARYRAKRPTLIITNLARTGLSEWIGERACDRLREDDGLVAVFDWESYRLKAPILGTPPRGAEGGSTRHGEAGATVTRAARGD